MTISKGRIPARIHGFPVTAGGALACLTSILAMLGADADAVKTLFVVCALLILGGVTGSFVASRLGYGEDERFPDALEQTIPEENGDWYGRL